MEPLQHTKESLENYKGKMIKVVMRKPIKIHNKNIETSELRGYFHCVLVASNSPHLPFYLYFVHESLSNDPKIELRNENTTKLYFSDMVSLSLVE